MADPTITDGTLTITFNAFEMIDYKFKTKILEVIQHPTLGTAGASSKQQAFDGGAKEEIYTFHWQLKSTSGGDSAWVKFKSLRDTIWKTEESTQGFHRKVTFTIQESDETFFGKIATLSGPIEAGKDEIVVNGLLDFVIDDVTATF